MEPPFDRLDGVLSTSSGYTGGHVLNPTYDQVASGGTGHAEVVRIRFDPDRVSYAELLEVFWRNIDPLDGGGQFCDRGDQYRSEIFAETDRQYRLARQSRQQLMDSGKLDGAIVTAISRLEQFYPAEEYHQDYYQKNPVRYRVYRFACGRERRLEALWSN